MLAINSQSAHFQKCIFRYFVVPVITTTTIIIIINNNNNNNVFLKWK